jgi:hypothetical protein
MLTAAPGCGTVSEVVSDRGQHGRGAVRWQRLFADLEAQAEALAASDFEAELAERTRIEVGKLRLVDRLRPAVGHVVQVSCAGAGWVRGRLDRVGSDWLLITEDPGREIVVSLSAVASVVGLGALSTTPGSEGRVASRLDLRHALRGLVRDRAPVELVLIGGMALGGTLDRIGADFVELAEHPRGEARRARAVCRVHTVPLGALAAVRTW